MTEPKSQELSAALERHARTEGPHATQVLALEASVGLSAFHLHFKTVTGMSPLQFQKRLGSWRRSGSWSLQA